MNITAIIKPYDRTTKEPSKGFECTLGEYSEWLKRAVKRGYGVTDLGDSVSVYADESLNKRLNFIVTFQQRD